LTVKADGVEVETDTIQITVTDPNTVYSGTNTVCVCDTANEDFTGAPTGARQVTTDDLSDVNQYLGDGVRLLLHRGSSWTFGGFSWTDDSGPTTIGAFGTGTGEDDLGIYSNAPEITLTGSIMSFNTFADQQDLRIMDLKLRDPTNNVESIGVAHNIKDFLLFRVDLEGFNTSGWVYNRQSVTDVVERVGIVQCRATDGQYGGYCMGEQLAVMGCYFYDAQWTHTLRITQAYHAVVQHNKLSGSSVVDDRGRHELKLHGPSEDEIGGSGNLDYSHRTEQVVISDNVFGCTGPYSCAVGPQNAELEENLSDIIIERNWLISDLGTLAPSWRTAVPIQVWGRYYTIRNNIIDIPIANESIAFTGINVEQRGIEHTPLEHEIYHNTIYNRDDSCPAYRGVYISSEAVDCVVRNNVASFPNSGVVDADVLIDNGTDTIAGNNVDTDSPDWIDPDNVAPLSRDFTPQPGSPLVDGGTTVTVWDDFDLNSRTGTFDLGAYELQTDAPGLGPWVAIGV
jgi:hypothetical protein